MPGPDPRKAGPKAGRPMTREERKKRAGLGSLQKKSDTNEIFMMQDEQKMAKGGRAGYKMGSKCKLATKGKGRAYGKNS